MKKRNITVTMILLVLACYGFSPKSWAVSPPADGGYSGANTAEGQTALFSLTSGQYNAAIGWVSLYKLTSGSFNTGIGAGTLFNNTADHNTASGAAALFSNVTGFDNTADGVYALINNNNGSYNTAIGVNALFGNTSGSSNTANGANALASNTADYNTATGVNALELNTTGSFNTAVGFQALSGNTTADYNIAFGFEALTNSAIGSTNIALGPAAGFNLANGSNDIYIGNFGASAGESNTIRIGYVVGGTVSGVTVQRHTATFIAGIHGATTSDPGSTVPVYVDANGNLGTAASSERFKTDIKSMAKSSEALLALKPVTFHYKSDHKGITQFGLVAEEVAKVNPALVAHDRNGEIYTVRYDAINAMLLNEFLKEHHKVDQLEKQVALLGAALQNISAQLPAPTLSGGGLGLSKSAPQMVINNQ